MRQDPTFLEDTGEMMTRVVTQDALERFGDKKKTLRRVATSAMQRLVGPCSVGNIGSAVKTGFTDDVAHLLSPPGRFDDAWPRSFCEAVD